jgi:hypothetical protein
MSCCLTRWPISAGYDNAAAPALVTADAGTAMMLSPSKTLA